MKFLEKLTESKRQQHKLVSVLIDPENYTQPQLQTLAQEVNKAPVDVLFVGGSMVTESVDQTILTLKKLLPHPIVLFPGHPTQVSKHADALLYLSLISGRNPELLIGQHVQSAPHIKKLQLETIPTGYILLSGGSPSAVQYMSQTQPIPNDKTDILQATAMAGELLGLKALYLEAGSGAAQPVSAKAIRAVRQAVALPIICGGGITTAFAAQQAFDAGADMIVIGNALEKDPFCLPNILSFLSERSFKN